MLSLLVAIVCIALGVVLYYQGILREYFAVRNFWHIRIPGWVGLILVAVLLVYLLINAAARLRPPFGGKGPAAGNGKGQS